MGSQNECWLSPLKLKIPFGLCNDKLLPPSLVPQGLSCKCICPSCQAPLVAKRPKKKAWHFAHHQSEGCAKGYETSLHLAAKQVLCEQKQILVPSVEVSASDYDEFTGIGSKINKSISSKLIVLDFVEKENRNDFEGIVPDIVAHYRGKLLLVEIAVTSFIDESKLAKLKKLAIPTLEIDLSNSPEIPSLEDIEQLVIREGANRTWIVNPRKEHLKREATAEARIQLIKKAEEMFGTKLLLAKERDNYHKLSNKQKLQIEILAIGVTSESLLPFIGISVKGGNCFGVSLKVWQAAVYRRYIHDRQGDEIEVDEVSDWLVRWFSNNNPFQNADKVAVWFYLKELEMQGVLKYLHAQQFAVIKDVNGNFLPF